ncbi:SRPBCC family protein [Fictibacillus phosphorivorans]|uniref:SRPBCC family protein n=1 Tax=Fictibacillus phosphorivorans TaxID=1221500 RepID=UPI00203F5F6B|nr:SRPBCC family protein [Fictibacillus phosphorivorans]MCM3718320.1 SRPBCC family protein [Fictibacillus phosphorivorans]MCM3775816.1 SRPBCC family protein [Fictibacillus phosphorivorans]
METSNKVTITVETTVQKPVAKVWKYWTEPQHTTKWNFASDDWHAPKAENDLRVGGRFLTRMEAKDGSFGFDFSGVYDEVKIHEYISYTIDDGRKVEITFINNENNTKVIEKFEAEGSNPTEMQEAGWQAILDNFKTYSENL